MATKQAGVSILMATYNGSAHLCAQLESVLAQATVDDELIVLDDQSSDDSVGIVKERIQGFPNVTVVVNDRNLGVRGTFESLLKLCTKDIIFLSDQDDVWIDGRKTRMIAALNDRDCVAVLANARVLTGEDVVGTFFPETPAPNVGSLRANFVRNNFIGCCMAFRREVLDLALPFPATISMHDWWIGTCAMATGKVRYQAAPSLLYRRHAANQSPRTRRSWRRVLKDRAGNLAALAVLLQRVVRRQRAGR